MDYVVGLISDRITNMQGDVNFSSIHPTSFEGARNLLKDFVKAHGGQIKGWFTYNCKKKIGDIVVNMSESTATQLHDYNVFLLKSSDQEPFISRIEGEDFEIFPRSKVTIHPQQVKGAECTI